ncbi:MAG: histidine phosphatase family protein [Desulfocapsaceae bacterium]|nr:histidine phosphatase family protein [Desulfocapsaceae bacterium]
MVSNLVLLRHGRTALAGRYVGATDIELDAAGIEQVRSLRPVLAGEDFDRILCSPMHRCRQTAELLGLDVTLVDDLREIDFGLWETRNIAEIEESDPENLRRWIEDPAGFCFPGGECRQDFIDRLERFNLSLQRLQGEKALIISHAGVIRHLICVLLGLSFESYLLFEIREARLTTVNCFSQGGVLTGLNREGLR